MIAALLVAGTPVRGAEPPRLVTQTGHARQIAALALSPDGQLLLTSSTDQTVRLWRADTGKLLRTYRSANPLPITSPWLVFVPKSNGLLPVPHALAFAPDGKRFLVGSADSRVYLIDVLTGALVRSFSVEDNFITRAGFSPDGTRVFAASPLDKAVRVWDSATGKELLKLELPMAAKAVALSADNAVVAVGVGTTTRVYDARTKKELHVLPERLGAGSVPGTLPPHPTAFVFSPDGKQLVSGNWQGTLRLWELATGKELQTFETDNEQLRTGEVRQVMFSPDGTQLYAGGYSSTAWDIKTAKPVRAIAGKDSSAWVTFSANGARAAASDMEVPEARVWDVNTGGLLRTIAAETHWAYIATFAPDGKALLTDGLGGTARVWSLETGAVRLVLRGHTRAIRCATYSPDGKHILTGSFDGVAILWDAGTGKELQRFVGHKGTVSSVAFGADPSRVVTGGWDGTARVWDAATGKQLHQFNEVWKPNPAPPSRVGSAVLSKDGKTVLTSTWTGFARLWSVETGKELRTFTGHSDVVVSARFSADESLVLTASGDGTARLWDAATGKETVKFSGHTSGLPVAAFVAEGKQVLTAGVDGTARLWDATTGKQLKLFARHDDNVNAAAVSPDGKHVVTTGADGTARLWDANTEKERCRVVAFRNGEWAVVAPDGRFDASNLDSVNGVHWVAADEPLRPLPPEIFLRDYYEPKLLARVLAGEKLPPVRSVADLNRVQPLVRVAKVVSGGAADEVSVTVDVAGQARPVGPALVRSGAADLHLFRDGRLVALRAGPLALDPKTGRATVTFDGIKLPRAGLKQVEFSAYAFNSDRVKSDTHRLAHALPALDPHKGTAFVVCVGVNGFDAPKWDLRFAAPDAKLMGDTLAAGLKASGRYEKVVVVTLLSEPTFDKAGKRTGIASTATKANIRAALAVLGGAKPDPALLKAVPAAADLRAARPEDAVILTFSTHGFNGTGGRFYLFPSDIGAGRDVTDETLARAVSTDELSDLLRGADAGELVLIADACHSAASVAADGFKPGPMGSRGLGQLAYDKRMRVLAASQADDVALEDDRVGHGLLTYALCKDGLGKSRADFDPPDGAVQVGEWLRYGVRRVPGLADEVASGKARAVSATGRALVPVDGKQSVTQLPALFDFTRGADGPALTGKK